MKNKHFTERLINWHINNNTREMPWKGIKDAYKVWLSEIILQQTRVEQGLPYYEKFVKKYPDIFSLANAKDADVMKLWEGLGYYSRCRNLLHTARSIAKNSDGKFPQQYNDLLQLKGIGAYTASAIASFCYDLPYAVVDGNVFRVLSRITGIDTPADSTEGKKIFTALANTYLDKKDPGRYNQAIMDFGATVCKPVAPYCSNCTMQKFCIAYKTGRVNTLPVKEKIIHKKIRWFNYIIFSAGGKKLIQQRLTKDIWQSLYEFYLLETESNMHWSKKSVITMLETQLSIKENKINTILIVEAVSQQLTHQLIKGWFIEVHLDTIPSCFDNNTFHWLDKKQIKKLAFPKFINQYLTNY